MAEDFKVTYEIPGFERRRPRIENEPMLPQGIDESAEVIVISSDEEGEDPVRQIKIEDIKVDLSVHEFDPTMSPIPSYITSFPNTTNSNVNQSINNPSPQQQFITPNQSTYRTDSNKQVRMFAVKSTAKLPASNLTVRAFDPVNATQSFDTNEIRRSYTPSGRESVLTNGSTPESGFIDQLFEDYQSEIEHDYMPPQPIIKTVWSSRQGYKGTTSNTSKPVEQLNIGTPIPSEHTVQLTSNAQKQPNGVQSDQPLKTLTVDPKTAEMLSNLVQQAIMVKFVVVPKKEELSDHDDNDLLEEIAAQTSSSSSATMSESDSASYTLNRPRPTQKRASMQPSTSSISKRRKRSNGLATSPSSAASSDSYRPSSDDEDDEDDDEDVDSNISNETEPMAGASRSPQYEPESDLGT